MLSIGAGILTYNVLEYEREELLSETVASFHAQGISPIIVDNNSSKETREYLWSAYRNHIRFVNDGPGTCGAGMNRTIREVVNTGVDIVVFSNDDIRWKPGSIEKVVNFWEEAPTGIVIMSGFVCNMYEFNTIFRKVEYGGTPALVRWSATGGAWTFRARDWWKIYPISERPHDDDVNKCHELMERGYSVCEANLTEHLGADKSTWGNEWSIGDGAIDLERWGLE